MIELTDPIEQTKDAINIAKYKTAGQIVTKTVDEIVKNVRDGIKLTELSNIGNHYIKIELDKVHKDIKYKGLTFPICLSLNQIGGHYIPQSDTDIVKEGDILKIELGAHIDGFPANIVYSTIVSSSNNKISDKRSNVMKACIEASREIAKIMKPGKTNKDVANIMKKCAENYGCNLPVCNEPGAIPGILSFQMSRYIIDGYNDDEDEFIHRFILSKENPNYDFSMRENEFEENEVYGIDILMSTGSGRLHSTDKIDIYRRNHETKTQLKIKASRETLSLFNRERFPICVNTKETKYRLGLKECLEKKLIERYPVVCEKEGEYIARIKFTVIVKDKPILICGKPADAELNKLA